MARAPFALVLFAALPLCVWLLSGCPFGVACTQDADCAGDEMVCELSPTDRESGLCLARTECARDFDCAAHDGVRYVCSDGTCRVPCDDDAGCGDGWTCALTPSSLRACVPG